MDEKTDMRNKNGKHVNKFTCVLCAHAMDWNRQFEKMIILHSTWMRLMHQYNINSIFMTESNPTGSLHSIHYPLSTIHWGDMKYNVCFNKQKCCIIEQIWMKWNEIKIRTMNKNNRIRTTDTKATMPWERNNRTQELSYALVVGCLTMFIFIRMPGN